MKKNAKTIRENLLLEIRHRVLCAMKSFYWKQVRSFSLFPKKNMGDETRRGGEEEKGSNFTLRVMIFF